MSRVNLVGLLPSELEDLAVGLGASRYRGRQLATWIFRKSVFDLEAMTDLPKDFRAALAERAVVEVLEPERLTPSQDGSQKLVFALHGGSRISSVLMPDDDRMTLCVSTQAGCGFACAFCLTGVMGLERNLTAAEIVGQVLAANRLLEGEGRRATHIVFMGMGEPLANYTVGLVPGIEKLGREDLKVNLAISLHAATDEVRERLMPVNRSFDLAALMGAVKRYPLASRQRVFFEYVMLEDVNDTADDARRLARLLRGLKAKVNLIPFNDWEGAKFRRPPLARILSFQSVLLDAGITTTVRWSKGEDIGAACGQLRESPALASVSESS